MTILLTHLLCKKYFRMSFSSNRKTIWSRSSEANCQLYVNHCRLFIKSVRRLKWNSQHSHRLTRVQVYYMECKKARQKSKKLAQIINLRRVTKIITIMMIKMLIKLAVVKTVMLKKNYKVQVHNQMSTPRKLIQTTDHGMQSNQQMISKIDKVMHWTRRRGDERRV